MNSLTYKLAAIFLAISLIPLIVGASGALILQTAAKALNDNNKALQDLSALLSAAGVSLADNARLQANANSVTARVADSQEVTYSTLKAMSDAMLPRTFAIARMRFALADASAAERALLLALNMRHLDEKELKATRDAQIRNINVALASLQQARVAYLALRSDGEEQDAWNAFEKALAAWQANHDAFMSEIANLDKLVEDLVRGGPLFASSSRKAYDTVFVTGKNAREACEKSIELLNRSLARAAEADVRKAMETQTRSRTLMQDLDRESDAVSRKARDLGGQIETAGAAATAAAEKSAAALEGTAARFWYMVAFSGVGVIVAMAIGLTVAWRISKPVRTMATHMSRLARGDLTDNVPEDYLSRKDEIGQLATAMQNMILSNRAEIKMADAIAAGDYTRRMPLRSELDQLGRALGTMVATSNDTMKRVSRAVDRVGTGASAVSDASRSQMLRAKTMASAVEEIARAVNDVDSQAQDNADHARRANQLATDSRDAARRGYGAVTELVAAIGEIQQAGKKIASVAKLIDDIAFQTNLLALNAAVEAARAGRHGRGFSVVADEVRNLSGRSAKAARETGEMVEAMTGRVEAGAQLAARTDSEFREIVKATDQAAQLFNDIADSSRSQSGAMAQIASGLGSIDHAIQDNTRTFEQTAALAQTLSRQAEELRAMVARFKLLEAKAPGNAPAAIPADAGARLAMGGREPDQRLLPGS